MSTSVRDLAALVLATDITAPKEKSIAMASETTKREVIPTLSDCGNLSYLMFQNLCILFFKADDKSARLMLNCEN